MKRPILLWPTIRRTATSNCRSPQMSAGYMVALINAAKIYMAVRDGHLDSDDTASADMEFDADLELREALLMEQGLKDLGLL